MNLVTSLMLVKTAGHCHQQLINGRNASCFMQAPKLRQRLNMCHWEKVNGGATRGIAPSHNLRQSWQVGYDGVVVGPDASSDQLYSSTWCRLFRLEHQVTQEVAGFSWNSSLCHLHCHCHDPPFCHHHKSHLDATELAFGEILEILTCELIF